MRLYLHVGMPKTGTTYVQSVLHAAAARLPAQGLTMLPGTRRGNIQLSAAVREAPVDEDRVARFGRRLAKVETPRVLVSDELLGGATSEQIERFLAVCPGVEAHVVVSVRSLSRLLPSTWQQRIQQRGETPSLPEFLDAVVSREGDLAERWWTDRGVVPALERWAEHVPLERMHVVTMPGAGSDPRTLIERYADLLGLDPGTLDVEVARPNVSLGWAQAEVLRLVRERVPKALVTKQDYLPVGKGWLGAQHLAPQHGAPPRMPATLRGWCEEEAAATIAWLAERPIEVVGDPDDLRPEAGDFVDDFTLDADAIAEAAVAALTSIALEKTLERAAD